MHVEKYTQSQAGGLIRHYEREGGLFADMMEPHKKNQNIDWTRTDQNYSLAPYGRGADYIKQRCSEVRCLKRSDVKVMCDWVVTIPQKLLQDHPEREREFFEQSYSFLSAKYGRENIISAVVHKDETTPHLHFAFVPVVPDKKRGGYKVSAKECLTRQELQKIHDEMSAYLTREMGLTVDLRTGGTIADGMTVDQLKSEKMRELQELTANVEEKRSELAELEETISILSDRMEHALKVYNLAQRRLVSKGLEGLERERVR